MSAPANAPTTIRRDLFTKNRVHIYPIPPLKSISGGYKASDWGVDRESSRMFTARLRIVETTTIFPSPNRKDSDDDEDEVRKIETDVRLEDPDSGELFANCPYTGAVCVEQVLDSSRFFAIRVVDGSRKAYLGIGFEDRGSAFDFGVCLQEVRRHNNLDAPKPGTTRNNGKQQQTVQPAVEAPKQDYSLKEGETIKITIGNKGRRKPPPSSPPPASTSENTNIPLPFLPPPPSAEEEKKRRRESYKQSADLSEWASSQDWGAFETTPTTTTSKNTSTTGMGFDDDPFGDFV